VKIIDDVLKSRGEDYGEFINHAALCQKLKKSMRSHKGWSEMPSDVKESLEMIQHKIARVINGNECVVDHWTDISGYARLVEKRMDQVLKPYKQAKKQLEK